MSRNREFLSTPSARRATGTVYRVTSNPEISIHALREEGDAPAGSRRDTTKNFYPRPPRGGRRRSRPVEIGGSKISIHALREEGDQLERRPGNYHGISIHALREEGDPMTLTKSSRLPNFYPRPPRGGRHMLAASLQAAFIYFYPRPPRGGRQKPWQNACSKSHISIHALREEGDRKFPA